MRVEGSNCHHSSCQTIKQESMRFYNISNDEVVVNWTDYYIITNKWCEDHENSIKLWKTKSAKKKLYIL